MPIVGFNEMVQKTLLLDDKIVKLYRKNILLAKYCSQGLLHFLNPYYKNEFSV